MRPVRMSVTRPRFYVREGLAPGLVGSSIELPAAVAHHAVRVVRMGVGDTLALFDGTGGEYRSELVAIDKRGARARLVEFVAVERESPLAVTLVQAIVASDAMDYTVRKAVELGIFAIAPVMTARSSPLRAGERADKRVAHWNEIAVAACEQCGRNRIPAVLTPQALDAYAPEPNQTLFVCAPDDAPPLASLRSPGEHCAIAVGPEGGFTSAEITQLERRGARRVGLGPRILRTETAALAAITILQALSGDMR